MYRITNANQDNLIYIHNIVSNINLSHNHSITKTTKNYSKNAHHRTAYSNSLKHIISHTHRQCIYL